VDQSKPQDQEIDIYPLALAKFLQVAPELGANILSYKDISNDLPQALDIKVGVFILRTGTEIFYVPVVSKAENIYPIDSIFQVSKSMFFPLTRKMIDVVLTASKNTQGKASKIPDIVNKNPDLTSLITPPRTGKFAYASTSRLNDFLSAMPDHLKQFTMTKVAAERSICEDLNKLFPIVEIFQALKSPSVGLGMAAKTNEVPVSLVTGVPGSLTDEEVMAILNDGYETPAASPAQRVAVVQNANESKFQTVTMLDGNSDYELVMNQGLCREAFIPLITDIGSNANTMSVALFTNGDFATSMSFVAKGEVLDRHSVLETLFSHNPPVLPRDVNNGDKFAVIDGNANLLGVFQAHRVLITSHGTELGVSVIAGAPTACRTILASPNYGAKPSLIGSTLHMPQSSLVLILKDNITSQLEVNAIAASKRQALCIASILDDQMNIGYDNVEFTVNNKVVGSEANMMHKLASEEGIDPQLAKSFIKQAKERKFLKVYLSKKASQDFKPAEEPYSGQKAPPVGKTGLNGSFIPSVQNSLKLGDAQSTEVTIISELLQAPDMYELIAEYQPDLEQCIDKLGRILFLSRVNINQLAEGNDIDSVFSFLASLKNTYRSLGDNFIKLNELLAIKPDAK
jgi:hypothetical protein